MSTLTREEVSTHNKETDCYIIINNEVYDVTQWIHRHPGGKDLLLAKAGQEATSYFEAIHKTNEKAKSFLHSFHVASIAKQDRMEYVNEQEPFMAELLSECLKLNLFKQPKWFKNKWFFLRILNYTIFLLCHLSLNISSLGIAAKVTLTTIKGIVGTSLFGLVAHESTHRLFLKSRWAKLLLRLSWPIVWPFIEQQALTYEHNAHHIKIGDPDFDYEVAGLSHFIRYSSKVPYKSYFRFQHHYSAIVYPFYANILGLLGLTTSYWERHKRLTTFVAPVITSFLTVVLFHICLPYYFTKNISEVVALFLVYQCTLFLGIYVTAAINHFVPSITDEIPAPHQNSYGYYACHNTTNYCTNAFHHIWYSGGFNIQIEHHLNPFIPMDNLQKMTPVVKALCKKYGYPYKEYASLSALWSAHRSYLKTMGATPIIQSELNNKANYEAR